MLIEGVEEVVSSVLGMAHDDGDAVLFSAEAYYTNEKDGHFCIFRFWGWVDVWDWGVKLKGMRFFLENRVYGCRGGWRCGQL